MKFTSYLGDEDTSGYLPYIPLGVRSSGSNEINLTRADDVVSPGFSIPIDFPFGNSVQSTVYVSGFKSLVPLL